MSSFSSWYKNYQEGKGLRQITYVLGTEPVLASFVVSKLVRAVNAVGPDLYLRTASRESEREIWNQLDRRPIAGGQALSLILEADQLQQKDRLIDWVKNKKFNPQHFVILSSNEPDAPRVPVGDPKDRKTEVVPYLKFGAGGFLVECKPFTPATVKTAIHWVRSICPMTDQVAGYLMNRADANLRLVRDTAEKLAVFPGSVTQGVVNDLLAEQPRDSFVDALLALDKKTALAALRRTDKQDFSRIIGTLDSTLELAGLVHDSQLENRPRFELIKAAGKRAWLLPDIEKVAKHYDVKRRIRSRQLLLMADEVLRAGESVGIMEAVIALW